MSKQLQTSNLKTSLLNDGFAGDLVIPGDPDYAASLLRFAKNATRNAALVAFVKCTHDVSKVIKFVNTHSSSNTTPIPIVVRGGGHSPSGASSTDGGIVIDLSRHINSVRVDVDKKLAYVGGGATWAAVDKEAIKYGLATTGGTVNNTGVGGLSLGGGFGWLMGTAGMVIDNIVQVTIVTANGSILTANASSHPDLFWGIRGGGCNFGCVTEFVYQLHPQPSHVFAGPLIFPPPLLPAVVTALNEWYPTASEKEGAAFLMTNKGPTGQPMVGVLVFYNGDEEEGRKRFAKLIALGPVVNGATTIPYEAVNAMQNDMIPYGANYLFNGTIRGQKPVETKAVQEMFNQMLQVASTPGACTAKGDPSIMIMWEFLNLKKAASIPVDATAFRMRVESPSLPLLMSWEGDSVEATEDARERLRTVKRIVEENLKDTFAGGMGENDTGYGNYEAGNVQSVDQAAKLYGGNYPRLQDVKRRYDPDMLFRSWYPIQPSKAQSGARNDFLGRITGFFRRFM